MQYNTPELCNLYTDLVDVLDPLFSNFGGRSSFGGMIVTVKCFESNGLISHLVKTPGQGKVLVIDGGGSTRKALIDLPIAQEAEANGWEGIICYGSVRDVDDLEELDLGIQALVAIPVGANDDDIGECDVSFNFAGVSFLPDDYIYADNNGIILSADPLDIDE